MAVLSPGRLQHRGSGTGPAGRVHALPLLIALAAFHVEAAHAEQHIFVLDIDNDWFAGTDRYYTSGLRLTRIRPADGASERAVRLAEAVPLFPDHGRVGVACSLGQNVYTPRDQKLETPNPDDRPYAGWLYASAGIGQETGQRLDRLQMTLGVVGPASLASRTQRMIHRVTGPAWPRGWDSQLGNEPTLMLSYERQWRARVRAFGNDGWGADWTPHVGGSLGTPFTYLNTGFMVRVGRNLPMDYGPPRIQPGLSGSGLFESRQGLQWYGFAGVDLRLVGHDLFLDGNTWRESAGVKKDRYVGDLQMGVALSFKRMRVAYTHVLRTREFRTQARRQNFGALSVSWLR
ncbi:lipid A deacylase LpxR family protein [Thioalkalivibrio thiocyanodenitrificans]|uniref:lipid A deacylase LpxR family protein n=1 Tax=Thioalkalivibrio thiocyanodenitrificans TaxID=243063 RepID=UPI000A0562F6|nr:lipid A deacylase LpxR family protein [Thioalkalivibrio thiocyanodenitrificans]